jgi:hypothetical protein
MEEGANVTVDEIVVLNKYEGDLTEEEMADAQPIETITVKNGEIVEHIVWEEVNNNGSN